MCHKRLVELHKREKSELQIINNDRVRTSRGFLPIAYKSL